MKRTAPLKRSMGSLEIYKLNFTTVEGDLQGFSGNMPSHQNATALPEVYFAVIYV